MKPLLPVVFFGVMGLAVSVVFGVLLALLVLWQQYESQDDADDVVEREQAASTERG